MSFFTHADLQGAKRSLPTLPQCGKCGLFKTCQSPKMPPSGKGERRILFVGEAPGEVEDLRGEQFVGKTGKELRRVLRGLHLELDDCVKTNAASCRPPNNDLDPRTVEYCQIGRAHV